MTSLSDGDLVMKWDLALLKFRLPFRRKIILILMLLCAQSVVEQGNRSLVRTGSCPLFFYMGVYTYRQIDSLKKFYGIFASQGVKPSPLTRVDIPPSMTLVVSTALEVSSASCAPDQPPIANTTLIMEDHLWFLNALENRDRDQDQSPLLKEDPPKWACMSESVALGSTTNILKLAAILLAHITHTLEEFIVVMSKEDPVFLQNLLEADKVEFFFEATFYRATSLFSLASVNQGDVLTMGYPFKERDTWKEKCEAMEQSGQSFRRRLFCPGKGSLCKLSNMRHKYITLNLFRLSEVNCYFDEAMKSIQQEKESHVEYHKAHDALGGWAEGMNQ